MLRYKGETFNLTDYAGNEMKCKQVSKSVAKKAYEQGKNAWIHPCNMRVGNMWHNPLPMNKAVSDWTFEEQVVSFEMYNCNSETGQYAIFFVEAA